jgi:hypothetical protein
MTIKVDIQFSDKGEAARWLAKYYSRLYELPKTMIDALDEEFPYNRECLVSSRTIERAALAMLGREK